MINPAEYSVLYRQLKEYVSGEMLPLHMPGHKRNADSAVLPYGIDVTEVPGTDDLHDAEGILRDAMDRTARLYGADRTWYLVGGSTAGNLAAIAACAPKGSEVIVARNCHRSVFHAIELRELNVHWVMPETRSEAGIAGAVEPEEIARLFHDYPETRAVILTSPTYEGVVSDICAIAAVCHEKGVPLVVDEAHGAHFGFGHGFPESSVHCGADLVIQSFHKTLPALTQTAVLHRTGNRISDAAIERWLGVFETSSPSYPLMVSIDAATGLLREKGNALFAEWKRRLDTFRAEAERLRFLKVIPVDDPGKLLIDAGEAGITGNMLAARLREEYRIETEMSIGTCALAMTGMTDPDDAYRRLMDALFAIDSACAGEKSGDAAISPAAFPEPGEARLTIAAAAEIPEEERRSCPVGEAAGHVVLEYAYAYPPGIPFLVPGEEVTAEAAEYAGWLRKHGFRIRFTESGNDAENVMILNHKKGK